MSKSSPFKSRLGHVGRMTNCKSFYIMSSTHQRQKRELISGSSSPTVFAHSPHWLTWVMELCSHGEYDLQWLEKISKHKLKCWHSLYGRSLNILSFHRKPTHGISRTLWTRSHSDDLHIIYLSVDHALISGSPSSQGSSREPKNGARAWDPLQD